MQVDALYLHPVKSGKALAVDAFTLDARGPIGDRRYVVIDANGRFVSQREWPALGALTAEPDGQRVVLRHPLAGEVVADFSADVRRTVQVWADSIDAVDGGDAAAAWLGQLAGRPLRIAWQDGAAARRLRREPSTEVSLADGYPLLILTRAAVDELAQRFGAPVVAERFRPNIVVAGAPAHAEDRWRRVRIGAVTIDVVKPCERCAIPGLDPASGMSTPGFQQTLAAYRRVAGQVYFGMNAIHRDLGELRVGDKVTVEALAD